MYAKQALYSLSYLIQPYHKLGKSLKLLEGIEGEIDFSNLSYSFKMNK